MDPDLLFFALLPKEKLAEARRRCDDLASDSVDVIPFPGPAVPCIVCAPELIERASNAPNRARLMRELSGEKGAKFTYSERTVRKYICPGCIQQHGIEQLLQQRQEQHAEAKRIQAAQWKVQADLERKRRQEAEARVRQEQAEDERHEYETRVASYAEGMDFYPCIVSERFPSNHRTWQATLYCAFAEGDQLYLFQTRVMLSQQVSLDTVVMSYDGDPCRNITEFVVTACRDTEPMSVNLELLTDWTVEEFCDEFPTWELLRTVDRSQFRPLESIPLVNQLHIMNTNPIIPWA